MPTHWLILLDLFLTAKVLATYLAYGIVYIPLNSTMSFDFIITYSVIKLSHISSDNAQIQPKCQITKKATISVFEDREKKANTDKNWVANQQSVPRLLTLIEVVQIILLSFVGRGSGYETKRFLQDSFQRYIFVRVYINVSRYLFPSKLCYMHITNSWECFNGEKKRHQGCPLSVIRDTGLAFH